MVHGLIALFDRLLSAFAWSLFAFTLSLLLSRDMYVPLDTSARVRFHVRGIEFDFVDWTLSAVGAKLRQASLPGQAYLHGAERVEMVKAYFRYSSELERVEGEIAARFADPLIADPESETATLRAEQADLRARRREVKLIAEAILQEQVSAVLAEKGLAVAGQPFPPVAFRVTPLPLALIVSPRTVIRQDANIDIDGELALDKQVELEDEVAEALDVSTLIVRLGGIGTYPTMVAESSDLNWMAAVVAHEWTHNYLTLRPLGINYMASPELRTMNETTAEIVGYEIGAIVIERYYEELKPPPPPFENFLTRSQPPEEAQQPAFDFRAQMRATRLRVDELLAEGKVEEAETYMEARRRFFWEHGYQIRKLNQAYFAFYGAYPMGGGGASGGDPVGSAVRLLRRRSPDVESFVDTMAGFTSFEQLKLFLGLP